MKQDIRFVENANLQKFILLANGKYPYMILVIGENCIHLKINGMKFLNFNSLVPVVGSIMISETLFAMIENLSKLYHSVLKHVTLSLVSPKIPSSSIQSSAFINVVLRFILFFTYVFLRLTCV